MTKYRIMMYDNNTTIKSAEDVRNFFRFLIHEKNLNFHPDDEIEQCETVTEAEAATYNRLMAECFDVCQDEVYDIGFEEMAGI